jgi:peptidoglycan hydrolase-like protein with peptidoglycan-binding domain
MILKKGDKNDFVKQLQAKIGVHADGDFGLKTQEALKTWQKAHGLVADGVAGEKTLSVLGIVAPITPTTLSPKPTTSNLYSKDTIEKAVKAKGYKWFDEELVLNIVGVRNSSTGQKVTNVFDDKITVSYLENGVWQYHEWMNTTEPGKKGVEHYHNINGVARLVPGQYLKSHAIGLHQGKYEALRQVSKVKVFRDSNKDLTYDESKTEDGIFGINIHKAGADSTYVENWSEGCQVFKRSKDFDEFMAICRKAKALNGNAFTYTLITSNDLI